MNIKPLGFDYIVMDFETESAKFRRPTLFPPKPVGFAFRQPGMAIAEYWGWGHHDIMGFTKGRKNNCTEEKARRKLKEIWNSGLPIVFHNAKFDTDVAETHMGMYRLPWERVHDTEYLLFLYDPHAATLKLKPSAEKLLGWKPDLQEKLKHWILANVPAAKKKKSDWGGFIAEAPCDLVGRYAAGGDIRFTEGLFKLLLPQIAARDMLPAYNRERRLMPILLDSERIGIRCKKDELLRDYFAYWTAREYADELLRKRLHAPGLNLDSDDDAGDVLAREGIIRDEDWVYTDKGHRSVAKQNMPLSIFRDKKVAMLWGYRQRMTTCLSMFMNPWLQMALESEGIIFTDWNQVRRDRGGAKSVGARTARLSSTPNFQNIAKDFEDKNDGYEHPKFVSRLPQLPLLRHYLLPDEGHVWGHRDYNQQELRILGHFEQTTLEAGYNQKPYRDLETGKMLFDVHTKVQEYVHQITNILLNRGSTKIVNFADIYGQGLRTLAEKLMIEYNEAKAIRDAKDKLMPGVPELKSDLEQKGKDHIPIHTWGGAELYAEEAGFSKKYKRFMTFEYKLLNYLIQRSAAECTKEAVIVYAGMKKEARFLLTVHDEINNSIPKGCEKSEMEILRLAMESISFGVPMLSDGKTGPDWGHLKTFAEDWTKSGITFNKGELLCPYPN